MNSSNTTTAPPRRSKWLRGLFWAVICLVSLITVLWQWENWRSARELKEMRQQLIERIGTDDPRAIMPSPVSDAENFFALPIIEAWKKDDHTHEIPADAFWPKKLLKPELIESEDASPSLMNWVQWAAGRDLKGLTPAQALNSELSDANDLLAQLAAGLERPFACLKPAMLTALDNSKGDLWPMNIPNIQNLNDRHRELALHLRVAAQAGDSAKAQTTARILLRLFPEASASHGTIVSMLVSIATHEIAFEAIQDALSFPVWDERSLTLLQTQFAKDDDLRITRRAFCMEALWGHSQLMGSRQNASLWKNDQLLEALHSGQDWTTFVVRVCPIVGPIGWRDADAAQHLRFWLEIIGPDEDIAWLHSTEKSQIVREEVKRDLWLVPDLLPNPRRFICSALVPNIGNIHTSAAETLFHRRCLILACELEKHRIRHGGYPTALPELKGYELSDPARPGHLPGYRLEPNGYLLWSAGPDAIDDHGDTDKDWLWRMKRTP